MSEEMTMQVPEWRAKARAGLTLAEARAAGKDSGLQDYGTTSGTGVPAKAPGGAGTGVPPAMEPVILASARDRWLSSQLSYYTPQIVENTLRGAMAGNLMAQWQMFDLMEQTWPRLSKNLNELKNAVVDLEWAVQAFALKGQKPSAESMRRRDAVEMAIQSMAPEPDLDEADFDDTLYNVMDSVGKGIAVCETHWLAPGEEENESNLWMPRATKWVHPRYYGYPAIAGTGIEDRLMLNMLEVKFSNPKADSRTLGLSDSGLGTGPNEWVNGQFARFPRDQFILSVMKQKSGHPISGAMLRMLGFFWVGSNFAWEWALNLAQIFGVPIRWATYATGTGSANTLQLIEDMMANLGSAGWGVFPEGTKLELVKAVENARDNPAKAFIDAADMIADVVILGQTLTTSQGERGSQALGTIHKSVRDERIQALAKRTAKVMGQLLRAFCRLNFGDTRECPRLQPGNKESKATLDTATRFKTILGIPGVQVSKQQFYEENELVVPEAGEDVIEGQAAGAGQGGPGQEKDDGSEAASSTAVAKAKAEIGKQKEEIGNQNAATEKLVNRVLEDLTGVEGKWLAGVKPFFRRLVVLAQAKGVSDADFVSALEKSRREIPELFHRLDGSAVAKALEEAMGSAVVNGAVRGAMRRKG